MRASDEIPGSQSFTVVKNRFEEVRGQQANLIQTLLSARHKKVPGTHL